MAILLFLPVALALALIAALLSKIDAATTALALCISVGYGVSAAFPCDPGSPMVGSARQTMHNLGGAAQYLGGALSLLAIAEAQGLGFRAAGMAVGISALALSFESGVRGAIQRVAEACLLAGLIVATWS